MKIALLILAHGGDHSWKTQVYSALSPLMEKFPTKIVFSDEIAELNSGIKELEEKKNVEKIFVFPLFVSYSKSIEKAKKVLDKKDNVLFYDDKFPLCNIKVGEVLVERAMEKSKNPEKEIVVIIAHGAIEDRDDKTLLEKMQKIANFLKLQGFKKVEIATLRDDSPKEIRDRAIKDFKKKASKASIVLPLLVAGGETFEKIEDILGEQCYKLADPLMPSEKIIKLIKDEVRKARERAK